VTVLGIVMDAEDVRAIVQQIAPVAVQTGGIRRNTWCYATLCTSPPNTRPRTTLRTFSAVAPVTWQARTGLSKLGFGASRWANECRRIVSLILCCCKIVADTRSAGLVRPPCWVYFGHNRLPCSSDRSGVMERIGRG
jgi:hypothetical protein